MDCPKKTPSMAKVEAEEAPPPHKHKRLKCACCSGETSSDRKAGYPRTTPNGVTTDGLNKKDHQGDGNKAVYLRISPHVHMAEEGFYNHIVDVTKRPCGTCAHLYNVGPDNVKRCSCVLCHWEQDQGEEMMKE